MHGIKSREWIDFCGNSAVAAEKTKSEVKNVMNRSFILPVLLLVILSSCAKREVVYPKGTSIDGMELSGRNPDEVSTALRDAYLDKLSQLTYTIHTESGDAKLSASDLGLSYDTGNALSQALTNGGKQKAHLEMDDEKAQNSIAALCGKLTVLPVPAKAEYDGKGDFVFTEGRDGSAPDADDLFRKLKTAVAKGESAVITVGMKVLQPMGATYDELVAQNTVVAEFTTSFGRSPLNADNRVGNIKKAAEKVNGTRLSPGESFDTNAVLGDRNEENGWFTAPGIVNGKYRQEYGGGVCQVSTTLYNAALLADLQIDERTPHSIPVSYVDLGRDATISTGGPNLVFTNNTSDYLTIAALVNESEETVTVRIFGRKPEGYAKVELYSEQTGVIYAPEPQYVRDTSLRMGEYVTDRQARNGKRAATYRIFYDEDGNVLKSETVTRDTYTAFSAIVLYNN